MPGKTRASAALLLVGQLIGQAVPAALAQDAVRYFEENGVTYQEIRRSVPQLVWSTEYQNREQVIYRPEVTTELVDSHRSVPVPVTQYRWVTRIEGRWNPFVEPYVAYDWVPTTHWQYRAEPIKVPVTTTRWTTERRVVQVPVAQQRLAQREEIRRVPVAWAPRPVPSPQGYGGVARMESAPLRHGSTWQGGPPVIRR